MRCLPCLNMEWCAFQKGNRCKVRANDQSTSSLLLVQGGTLNEKTSLVYLSFNISPQEQAGEYRTLSWPLGQGVIGRSSFGLGKRSDANLDALDARIRMFPLRVRLGSSGGSARKVTVHIMFVLGL